MNTDWDHYWDAIEGLPTHLVVQGRAVCGTTGRVDVRNSAHRASEADCKNCKRTHVYKEMKK